MSVSASGGWTVTDTHSHTEDSDSIGGTGGTVMSLWGESRNWLLTNIVAGGTYTNYSSFDLPVGFVDDIGANWNVGIGSGAERVHGFDIRAVVQKPDGKPMSGTASIREGDDVIAQKETAGRVLFVGTAPPGALSGSDSSSGTREFIFEPTVSAVAVVESDVTLRNDLGTIKYGSVEGQVLSYDGDPVPNSTVRGLGAGTNTDEDGNFTLLAPGGTSATFVALDGTYEFDETIQSGQTTTLEFVFPKLTIEVLDADYEPVEDAPVTIENAVYSTNAAGKVELPTAPIGNYDVTVMDFFEGTGLSVSKPDTEYVYTVGPTKTQTEWEPDPSGIGGVKIKAVDTETGRRIRDVRAVERNSGAASKSNKRGICKILSTDTGAEVDILVGASGKRYNSTRIQGELPADEMLEVEVELSRRTQVVNS